jgi:hypothetical protein
MRPFFKDEGFNFQTEIALGATYHQAADVEEVLATVERIRNGQAQSWVDEWSATADRLAAEATASADAGHSYSAARQFLRVSMYYSLASYTADGTGDSTLFAKLWGKHHVAWDRFVDLAMQDPAARLPPTRALPAAARLPLTRALSTAATAPPCSRPLLRCSWIARGPRIARRSPRPPAHLASKRCPADINRRILHFLAA